MTAAKLDGAAVPRPPAVRLPRLQGARKKAPVLLAILLLGTGIYYVSERMRGTDIDLAAAESLLHDIKQTDTQWSVDVQRLEMGLSHDAAANAAAGDAMLRQYQALQALNAGLGPKNARLAEIDTALQKFKATVESKVELVRRIDAQYALLGDTSRSLAKTCKDLISALETDKLSAEQQSFLRDLLNRLLSETMSLTLQSDKQVQDTIEQDIDTFRKTVQQVVPAIAPSGEAFVKQVELALLQRQEGNALLVDLTALPSAKAADDLRDAYGRLQQDLALRRRTDLEILVLLSGLLGAIVVSMAVAAYRRRRGSGAAAAPAGDDHVEAESRLMQAARIGQMIAGTTHEINTPLAYVNGTLSLLREALTQAMAEAHDQRHFVEILRTMKINGDDREQTAFEDITTMLDDGMYGIEQICALVDAMQNFCRLDRAKAGKFNINELLDNSLVVCRNNIKYVANIEKSYGDIPAIYCVPAQIGQIFLNLFNNAAQAMPKGPEKGTIRVKTARHGADAVRIDISDTGHGIPKEILPKIFDAFFTTKGIGSGTGMGLSIVYRIIRNHGGEISVESKVGVGTTFSVILPIENAAEKPASDEPALSEV